MVRLLADLPGDRDLGRALGSEVRLPRGIRGAALLSAALFGACAPDGSEGEGWAGEVRDSAGVVVVENAALPPAASPPFTVRELFTIGGSGAAAGPDLGYVADADIDGDTVYVLDQLARRVSVYHAHDATLLRTVGAPGEGPGEFSRFASSIILAGDSLLVVDWGRGRVHRFLRDGAFVDASLLGATGSRSWWRRAGDGRIHARSLSRFVDESSSWRGRDVLFRPPPLGSVEADAVGADTVFVFDYPETDLGGPGRPVLPLVVNAPTWEVLQDGRLVWGTVTGGALHVHAPDGTLERIVRAPEWTGRAPDETDRQALLELMGDKLVALGGSRATVDQLDAVQPDALPGITGVRAGPGATVWVQRMGAAADAHPWALNTPDPPTGWGGGVWDVLNGEGQRIGAVELGPRVRVLRITEDRILGVRWDELGREAVVAWEVVPG